MKIKSAVRSCAVFAKAHVFGAELLSDKFCDRINMVAKKSVSMLTNKFLHQIRLPQKPSV
jgi:hypothetical protein